MKKQILRRIDKNEVFLGIIKNTTLNYHFSIHRQTRQNLLEILRTTTPEDLITIPEGFNNNIYWNIAHCVATQQLLHYYLSGNPFRIDKYWIENYKKGTLANLSVPASEIEDLEFLLTETSRILLKDYDDNFFPDYTPYSTSYGIDLKSIQDAIIFNNVHESTHYGYILAQKRALLAERN